MKPWLRLRLRSLSTNWEPYSPFEGAGDVEFPL